MAKIKKKFVCQNCGYSTPKWMGRCTECGEWNSFVEELDMPTEPVSYTHLDVYKRQILWRASEFKKKLREQDGML